MRVGCRNRWAYVEDAPPCSIEGCTHLATLSKTTDGVVKRRCSIHWNHRTKKQVADIGIETLLRELQLV